MADGGGYKVRPEPLGTARHVRVVGIGAGASGINMIRELRRSLRNFEHVVYEKNDDVGGTWLENRYPGCRCDVPSHNYQYSWRKNPSWSNFFSPAEEIRSYLCLICEEENMMGVIRLGHRVVEARWLEARAVWELRVEILRTKEVFTDHADFLVDASGILNNWKWPDVPNREVFEGDMIHTANWPEDFEYAGKTVVVIGNGSSGVQLVPTVQPAVKKMYHIARGPTWVVPPRLETFAMGGAKEILSQIELDKSEDFSAEQIERFKSDPELYLKFVKTIEKEVNSAFPVILTESKIHAFATQVVAKYMTALLGGDARLCEAMIPKFPLGCRRMTPAPGYLQSLTKPNVELRTEGIRRFVAKGVELESGEVLEADAIICATGFDLSFRPRFPLVGRHGRNLQDTWSRETPRAYMSCAVAGLPNYFVFLGPNAPIGHGSVFTLSEHIARYIAGAIRKCQEEGIRALAPTQAAVDDFAAHIDAFMPRTAWAGRCRSWFKAGASEGPVVAVHPGSRIHFFHMLERFRGEDFEYVYEGSGDGDGAVGTVAPGNRFAYLGNGFSTKELDPAVDSTWYLDFEGDLARS